MRTLNTRKTRKKTKRYVWVLLLVLIVGGYSAARYLIDRSNYDKGYRAYVDADCTAAMDHFDRILKGWRLFDIGGYPALVKRERSECLDFQAGIDHQQSGNYSEALVAYMDSVNVEGGSSLLEPAKANSAMLFEQTDVDNLASPGLCGEISILLALDLIPHPDGNLPPLYLACGQVYAMSEDQSGSYEMYKTLLTEFPEHSLAAEAESALLGNPETCGRYQDLRNSSITERAGFMPSLYYHCGEIEEDAKNWAAAIDLYGYFLSEYPDHALALSVEAALANAIVMRARTGSAGVIPEPEASGRTDNIAAEVIIQNDSPEKLRLVFSGPDVRVEELPACSTCQVWSFSPRFCPEEGPIGHYYLEPGQYEVVIESISDDGVTPWHGTWNLVSGREYFNCFYILRTSIFP